MITPWTDARSNLSTRKSICDTHKKTFLYRTSLSYIFRIKTFFKALKFCVEIILRNLCKRRLKTSHLEEEHSRDSSRDLCERIFMKLKNILMMMSRVSNDATNYIRFRSRKILSTTQFLVEAFFDPKPSIFILKNDADFPNGSYESLCFGKTVIKVCGSINKFKILITRRCNGFSIFTTASALNSDGTRVNKCDAFDLCRQCCEFKMFELKQIQENWKT